MLALQLPSEARRWQDGRILTRENTSTLTRESWRTKFISQWKTKLPNTVKAAPEFSVSNMQPVPSNIQKSFLGFYKGFSTYNFCFTYTCFIRNQVSILRGRLPLALYIILTIYDRVEELLLSLLVREDAVFLRWPTQYICLFHRLIFLKN